MQWEICKVYVGLDSRITREEFMIGMRHNIGHSLWYKPMTRPEEEDAQGWARAERLAAEGWELVNVMPLVGGHEGYAEEESAGCSFQSGYMMFFKRLKAA